MRSNSNNRRKASRFATSRVQAKKNYAAEEGEKRQRSLLGKCHGLKTAAAAAYHECFEKDASLLWRRYYKKRREDDAGEQADQRKTPADRYET